MKSSNMSSDLSVNLVKFVPFLSLDVFASLLKPFDDLSVTKTKSNSSNSNFVWSFTINIIITKIINLIDSFF